MMSEVLAGLLRANLIAAVGVLGVLALRIPMRRLFGPELAYAMWAAPPVMFVATLMPPPVLADARALNPIVAAVGEHSDKVLIVWTAGMVLALALFAWAQLSFLAAVRSGRAGPAVVGLITPRIVMPADDGHFSPEERDLIRAHEREHVRRNDPRAGATAAFFQALCWFNPVIHLGAWALRMDQELACDAGVLRRRPRDRALYAKTLLKTQLAYQALPFGCHWGAHPLEVRVGMLRSPVRNDGMFGHLLLVVGFVAATLMAWNAQPPGVRHPPPLLQFMEDQPRHVVSVLLIDWPRDR